MSRLFRIHLVPTASGRNRTVPGRPCSSSWIAREAGATVTDATGQPHDLHSAATPALTSQLISLIRAADLTEPPDTPTEPTLPHADLDAILSHARLSWPADQAPDRGPAGSPNGPPSGH
jgi:hypothetical protein